MRRQERRAFVHALALAILVGLISQLWSDRTPVSIGDDSWQYHQIAVALRTGAFFAASSQADPPIGFVVRTPGFPIILAAGEALAPNRPRRSVLIPHTFLLLLLVAFLRTQPGGQIPIPVSVLAIALSLPPLREYFGQVATEWSAFVFSVALISVVCRFLRHRSPSALFLIALLTAFDVLIKPTLVFLSTLPAILPWLTKRRLRAFLAVAIGMLPLWTWLGFNYWRFDRLTLAPIAGYGLIFTGALVGGAEADRFTDSTTREFARHFNAIRPHFDDGEIADFNRNPRPRPEELRRKYHYTILAAFDAGNRLGVDYVEFNDILETYSIEAIRLHSGRYALHFASAVKNVSLPILLLMTAICTHAWARGYDRRILAYAFLTVFFHLGLLLVTAVVQPMDPRYHALCVSIPYFYTVVVVYLYGRAILCAAIPDNHPQRS